jgi:hypothetical protein
MCSRVPKIKEPEDWWLSGPFARDAEKQATNEISACDSGPVKKRKRSGELDNTPTAQLAVIKTTHRAKRLTSGVGIYATRRRSKLRPYCYSPYPKPSGDVASYVSTVTPPYSKHEQQVIWQLRCFVKLNHFAHCLRRGAETGERRGIQGRLLTGAAWISSTSTQLRGYFPV